MARGNSVKACLEGNIYCSQKTSAFPPSMAVKPDAPTVDPMRGICELMNNDSMDGGGRATQEVKAENII